MESVIKSPEYYFENAVTHWDIVSIVINRLDLLILYQLLSTVISIITETQSVFHKSFCISLPHKRDLLIMTAIRISNNLSISISFQIFLFNVCFSLATKIR